MRTKKKPKHTLAYDNRQQPFAVQARRGSPQDCFGQPESLHPKDVRTPRLLLGQCTAPLIYASPRGLHRVPRTDGQVTSAASTLIRKHVSSSKEARP